MPRPLIDIAPLLADIEQGTLILTPNSRLKNKLLQAYNHHQQQQGLEAWPNIRVFSLREWLLQCHDRLLDQGALNSPRSLANSAQLQQLWSQVITANTNGLELINPLRLASDASSALSTLEQWQLAPADVCFENDQQQQFCEWAEQVQQALDKAGLQTFESLQASVNNAYANGLLTKHQTLIALDFGNTSPLVSESLQVMANRLEKRNTHANETLQCQRLTFVDQDQEARQLALWAKQQLQDNPESTIGIVVPNLGQDRDHIARHLTEVFEPHFLLPETSRYTLPFNFSTGVPLGSTAIIHNTLALLRFNNRLWDCQSLIDLLLSPFWGIGMDLVFQEALISAIQNLGRESINTATLRQLCHQLQQRSPCEYGQWLDTTLQGFEELRRRTPSKQSPSRWVETFQAQLLHLAWPGERRLDSNEYQQIQQWHQLLEDFCRLDSIEPELSAFEAIDLLSRHAGATPFQAQTRESPIQVLGALEAAGLVFDHCWVIGMSHRDWPPAAQPNPLLPLDLQRQLRMPHADANRELEYARELTNYYQRCAKTVIFSHPQQGEDSHLSASPLIQHIPLSTTPDIHVTDPLESHIQAQQACGKLESCPISQAPPLTEFERQHVRGGSQILRNQAINPLVAFMIHRLGAKQPIEPAAGFTPIQRGHILHNAMKEIWDDLGDQQQLLTTNPAQLQSLVKESVSEQVKRYQRKEPGIIGENYATLEIERQSRLILGWLDQEKQRPGYRVVAHEQSLDCDISGLPLTLRLDRLDQLESGELIIIDYKTGSPNIKHWGGDRPEEPQLPLYALTYHSDIQALMFVQINARQTRAMGLGDLQNYHPDITSADEADKIDLPEGWPAVLEHWQQSLGALSQEFQQGYTENIFKAPQQERFYQYLAPILRLNEQSILDEDAF